LIFAFDQEQIKRSMPKIHVPVVRINSYVVSTCSQPVSRRSKVRTLNHVKSYVQYAPDGPLIVVAWNGDRYTAGAPMHRTHNTHKTAQ